MRIKTVIVFFFITASFLNEAFSDKVLTTDALKKYVAQFNADDEELYANISNKDALAFLESNIPLFECPDEDFQRTFYFRWWTYRKHVKKTPDGYVITEFLPKVGWSQKYNTINCPAGHHYYEGRWLHNPQYLDDYSIFWLRKGGAPRNYSFWIADSFYARHLVTPNKELIVDLLDDLIKNYQGWEKERRGNERGKDYNHSTYNDLIITGLVGLRPRADDIVEINPLLPPDTWDYFCLDNILYHEKILTIIWDRTGKKYKTGKGLIVFADGKKIAKSRKLSKVSGTLK